MALLRVGFDVVVEDPSDLKERENFWWMGQSRTRRELVALSLFTR